MYIYYVCQSLWNLNHLCTIWISIEHDDSSMNGLIYGTREGFMGESVLIHIGCQDRLTKLHLCLGSRPKRCLRNSWDVFMASC